MRMLKMNFVLILIHDILLKNEVNVIKNCVLIIIISRN